MYCSTHTEPVCTEPICTGPVCTVLHALVPYALFHCIELRNCAWALLLSPAYILLFSTSDFLLGCVCASLWTLGLLDMYFSVYTAEQFVCFE